MNQVSDGKHEVFRNPRIYHYIINDAYYQDLIPLESISLSVALLFLMHYYRCSDKKRDSMVGIFQAIGMVAFFAYFHYNMPELLSNKNSFSVLLGVGLISAGIIAAKMQDKCENTIDKRENTIDKCENTIDKSKFDKDQITKIAAVIFITIYFIVAPIFAGIGSGVIFSLKFDINDLLIIIFSELIPLIVIAITGMSLKIAIEMMIAVFGKKGEDEKSK